MAPSKINKFLIVALTVSMGLLVFLFVTKTIRERQLTLSTNQSVVSVKKKLNWTNALPSSVQNTKFNASVLYPYVVYSSLSLILKTLPTTAVRDFLIQYQDTPLADKMRKQWLTVLANQEKWELFLTFYQPYPEREFQCFYATALLKTGSVSQAYNLADKLWMVPYSQSPACDILFASWIGNQPLPTEKILERFYMALKAGNINVAKYLVTLLPAEVKKQAMLWLEVQALPTLIVDPTYFKDNDESLNDIIIYGIQRLASRDADDAVAAWVKLRKSHHFTAAQAQLAIKAIAIAYIKGDSSQAGVWLQQLEPAYLDNTTKQWRLLFTLQEENWPLLIEWIEQLPSADREEAQWKYWYARALEKMGQSEAAQKIYEGLAPQANYYGFLAAFHENHPIVIESESLPITLDEVSQFLSIPGIQRMRALYSINQKELGNAEWWFAIQHLPQKQRYIAAKVANAWKLYSLSLTTTTYLSDQKDIDLIYPKPYWQEVKTAAAPFNMNPAFIYAIIRQESLFNSQAVSYAGAQGLMQLMPATAGMLAKKNGLLPSDAENLTDPAINIQLGTSYLNRLLSANHNNPALAAAAYNAGPNRVKKWLPKQGSVDFDIWVDSIPYPETRTYVQHVLMYMIIYQGLLNKQVSLGNLLEPVYPLSILASQEK
ncbi:MAG: transglycosylase SLT domain-containing protein [Legionellales bacterium]|nr:transglycosylase SLT domain-containing protein [Legionellales bacterium]